MAQDRDSGTKVKDFLGGITSFSGADIEVIVFRDTKTLNYLKLDSIRNEKKEVRARESQLRKDLNQSKLRNDLIRRGVDTENLLYISPDQVDIPGSETYSPSADVFGKAQNQADLSNINNVRSIPEITEEMRQQSDRYAELEKEESKIVGEFSLRTLGTVHTVSYSSFREKFAVRTLGKVQAKSYTQGPRTIAGTMVFNVMQDHELMRIAQDNEGAESSDPRALLLDQIKPFNAMLVFSNEYGSYSVLILFDVTIQSEGQEMSVEQIITMNTMNFYATDIIPLTPIGNRFETYDEMLAAVIEESGGAPVTRSNRASYRSAGRLENIASRKDNRELSDEIDQMLSESRSLF